MPSARITAIARANSRLVGFLQRAETLRTRPGAIDLTLGNPQELPIPGYVEALARHLPPIDRDSYAYHRSDHNARAVVAKRLIEWRGLPFEPEDVALTPGAFGALAIALDVLVDPGDEVIFSLPPWFLYEGTVTQGVGQFCTNPGMVLVQQSDDGKVFKESLSKSIGEAPSGVMLSAGIRSNYQRGLEKLKTTKGVAVASQGKDEGEGYRGVPSLLETSADAFIKDHSLEEEVFGPSTLLITASSREQIIQSAEKLGGHLTATIHGTEQDLSDYRDLILILEQKVGRLIFNGYPTGVEVCHSMVHGGPYPSTTDSRSTSVGTAAIFRFARPVCYQNFPGAMLPDELKDNNPLDIWRLVNGEWRKN